MAVVKKTNVKRRPGYLLYIDKEGDISETKRGVGTKRKVKKVGLKREKGYLYYINRDGDIERSRMKRR
jgi:hypothetical protein